MSYTWVKVPSDHATLEGTKSHVRIERNIVRAGGLNRKVIDQTGFSCPAHRMATSRVLKVLVGAAFSVLSMALVVPTRAQEHAGVMLSEVLQVMDKHIPGYDEGYSTDVSEEICQLGDPRTLIGQDSPLFVDLKETSTSGELEISVTKYVWFLKSHTLIISGYDDGSCYAWIYVKPFGG